MILMYLKLQILIFEIVIEDKGCIESNEREREREKAN